MGIGLSQGEIGELNRWERIVVDVVEVIAKAFEVRGRGSRGERDLVDEKREEREKSDGVPESVVASRENEGGDPLMRGLRGLGRHC